MNTDESAELVRLAADAASARPGRGGQLQHPLLPAQPAPARRHRRRRAGRRPADQRALLPGLAALRHRLELAPRARSGGALRAVGDIGSHWIDLTSFVSGLKVAEVMADMATFIPVRQQPAGPVETFSTERATNTIPREIRTEDMATVLMRYENGARGVFAVSQLSAGPQEPPPVRGRRVGRRRRLGPGEPGPAVAGPPRPAERDPAAQPGADDAARPGRGRAAGRPRRRFRRHARRPLPRRLCRRGAGGMSEHPPYATFADGHEAMLVGDAIANSSRTGGWVRRRRPR